MTPNTPAVQVNPLDALTIVRAQKKLLRLYGSLCTWRKVGKYLGVSHVTAWAFVTNGYIPPRGHIDRLHLRLPLVLPSERKARAKREPMPKVWEDTDLYFKKVKK